MIDFHTHILPALDDGSRDTTETEGLLREEVKQGVSRIVATPHFYADRVSVEEFLKRRARSIERLQTHVKELVERGKTGSMSAFPIPQLQYGAEVYFFPGMGNAEKLPQLCIEGTNLILLEMPFMQWTDEILREVKDILQKQKLRIVLAHVERYPDFQKNRRVFEQVLALPLTIQLNGGSFLKGRSRRKFCLNMLSEHENIILGSDTHNLTSRPPNLQEARGVIEKKLGAARLETIDRLTEKLLEP